MRFIACSLVLSCAVVAHAADPDLFESSIRPVLVERCYSCHATTSKSIKGGLKLDSKAALQKGGDSGAVIVAGKPAESLLLKAIRHAEGVEKMPPNGDALTAKQIADFERWIAAGAVMPADRPTTPITTATNHWAFQPLRKSQSNETIDSLVNTKRESMKLAASPKADKRTWLRRVSIDLTGLPPTADEIRIFEENISPTAFAETVDRMLASPRYGERWGRHWLDVARFADTKDNVLAYGPDRIRPFAYTYRDYVIRAFNDDLPINQFLSDQLAADQIPNNPSWRLAALGYLTLGRNFDDNFADIIDDRIDTVTRGMLGLTVSCARCHDHKFDPIPTNDYYSLYGIFADCEVPAELPLLDVNAKGPPAFETAYGNAIRDLRNFRHSQYAFLLDVFRKRSGDYLERIITTKPDPIESSLFFFSFAPDELRPNLVGRWRQYLAKHAKPGDPIFGPWAELMMIPDENFEKQSPGLIRSYQQPPFHPAVRHAFQSVPVKTKADLAKVYGSVLTAHHAKFHTLPPPALQADDLAIEQLFEGPDGPAYFPLQHAHRYMSRAEADGYGGRKQTIDKLAVSEANAPARAMVVTDLSEIHDPHVFIRGHPTRPGEVVPRRFLQVLSTSERKAYRTGSGRLDLANEIVRHPLTARVFVNRIWMHHFGEPLVDSPSDFGVRTAKPIQSELLDYLADSLIRNGWSLKTLHRQIVLSEVYAQSSADRADGRSVDPENRYLWRANRRRLDFEAMRDGLLFAAGKLDFRVGGRPRDAIADPADTRRSVYSLVDRQSLPGVFRSFDFAIPDQSVDRRPQTTVPQQALFGLNSPFVMAQAQAMCDRPEVRSAIDPTAQIRALYRIALTREPDRKELDRDRAFVATNSLATFAQVLLLTNEFHFVD